MPPSAAERKRKSRANNPLIYSNEKEKSRERMSLYRAKNKAQKKAFDLKGLLGEDERLEIEARGAVHRLTLLRDWFASRKLSISVEVTIEKDIINQFVSKPELHAIDRAVAEFEMCLAQKLLCERPLQPSKPDSQPSQPVTNITIAECCTTKEAAVKSASGTPKKSAAESSSKFKINICRLNSSNNPNDDAQPHPDERQKARARMAIFRAKNKSQKIALNLKGLMSEEERKDIAARVAVHKRSLIRDWFNFRKHLDISSEEAVDNKRILSQIVSKLEMHKIEHRVAEFEISLAQEAMRARQLPMDVMGGSLASRELSLSEVSGCEDVQQVTSDQLKVMVEEDVPNRLTPAPPLATQTSSSSTNTSFKQQINEIPKNQAQLKNDQFKAANDSTAIDDKSQNGNDHIHAISALLVAAEKIESEKENSVSSDGGEQNQEDHTF